MKYLASLFIIFGCFICTSIQAQTYQVLIETSKGDMTVELYDDTPEHRDNFIKLVNAKFYDSLLFHRVIKLFMIQGGDPNSKTAPAGLPLGTGDLGYFVPAEFRENRFHKKGVLSAARLPDQMNPNRESSASQFYIVQGQIYSDVQLDKIELRTGTKLSQTQREAYKTVGGTPHLDGGYTVFGEVIRGLDVIDEIAFVGTDKYDRPIEDIRMKIKVIKAK